MAHRSNRRATLNAAIRAAIRCWQRHPPALLADVRDSAARFAAEYAQMPAQAWGRMVRWTAGQEHPAARAADARLCEVLVHHVDLRTDYTPRQWPADFVEVTLGRVVASLSSRGEADVPLPALPNRG